MSDVELRPTEQLAEVVSQKPLPAPVVDDGEITHCPHCKHKLLTHKSVLCNWCGKRIDNLAYQARAAEERAQQDAALKQKLQAETEETAKYGILGRLKRKAKASKLDGGAT